MKILVTGGTGFIGSHLVEKLILEGHQVRVLDWGEHNIRYLEKLEAMEFMKGDLRNKGTLGKALRDVEVVYHLASIHLAVGVSDQEYREVNIGGTEKILEACLERNLKRFVHCSSVGVLGNIDNPPANETYPYNPGTIYEKTKAEGEKVALKYFRKGVPVVVARPAWVYGPRCPRTLRLFKALKKGRFPFFGNGQTLRHPVYVGEFVRGLELCADIKEAVGQVYIIGDEKAVTVEQLIGAFARVLGVKAPRVHFPASPMRALGFLAEIICRKIGAEPPFSRRSMDFFTKNYSFDISKAKKELNYKPKVSLDEGLRMSLEWSKESGFL